MAELLSGRRPDGDPVGPRGRRRRSVLGVTLAVGLLGSCTAGTGPGSATTGLATQAAVVAYVGPEPVTEAEVADAVPPVVGGGPVIDLAAPCAARERAVTLAVADEVLALWAIDRGLAPPTATRPERILAGRAALKQDAGALSDRDFQAWLDARAAELSRLDHATVTWARFDDPAAARTALPGLAPAPGSGAVLALDSSAKGSGTIDHSGAGVDPSVARVAFALKRPGATAYTFDGTHAWIVRVDSIDLRDGALTPDRRAQLRTIAAEHRLDASAVALADREIARWPVRHVATCTLATAVATR